LQAAHTTFGLLDEPGPAVAADVVERARDALVVGHDEHAV
jgi:hypothetical protein